MKKILTLLTLTLSLNILSLNAFSAAAQMTPLDAIKKTSEVIFARYANMKNLTSIRVQMLPDQNLIQTESWTNAQNSVFTIVTATFDNQGVLKSLEQSSKKVSSPDWVSNEYLTTVSDPQKLISSGLRNFFNESKVVGYGFIAENAERITFREFGDTMSLRISTGGASLTMTMDKNGNPN